MTLADPPSLRGRLLRLLWWPLLAVLLLSAVYDYSQWSDRARSNQDLALSRIAIALATRLDADAARHQRSDLHAQRRRPRALDDTDIRYERGQLQGVTAGRQRRPRLRGTRVQRRR